MDAMMDSSRFVSSTSGGVTKKDLLEFENQLKFISCNPANNEVESFKQLILGLKLKCSELIAELENMCRLNESADDFLALEKLRVASTEIDKKYSAIFQTSAFTTYDGANYGASQPNQQWSAPHKGGVYSNTANLFEKPIGRGQPLRQSEQHPPSVGRSSLEANATHPAVTAQMPVWMPLLTNRLQQPPMIMNNLPGYYLPLIYHPIGMPVGGAPVQQPLQLSAPLQSSKAMPSVVKIEVINLSDSDEEKSLNNLHEPHTETNSQQEAEGNPSNSQHKPESNQPHQITHPLPIKSPHIYSVPIEMEGKVELETCDKEGPTEPFSPDSDLGKIVHLGNQKRPAGGNAKSPAKTQLPSTIYSFLQHANTPTRNAKPVSPTNSAGRFMDSLQLQPKPSNSTKTITYAEYKKRKALESVPAGPVKRSHPVKLGVPKKQSGSDSSSSAMSPNGNKMQDCATLPSTSKSQGNRMSEIKSNQAKQSEGSESQPRPQLVQRGRPASRQSRRSIELYTVPSARYKHLHRINHYYEATKNEDRTRCLICHQSVKYITKHYKEKHPSAEVLISRFSPADLQIALEEVGQVPPKEGIFKCRLCPAQLELSLFTDHISFHTGEYNYCCSACNYTFPESKTIQSHWTTRHSRELGPIPDVIELDVFPQPKEANFVPGYICPVCNWLQLKKERVEKHVEDVHGIDTLRHNKIKIVNMVPSQPQKGRPKRNKRTHNYAEQDEGAAFKLAKAKTGNATKAAEVKLDNRDALVPCLICNEPINKSVRFKCTQCKNWLHVKCSTYDDTCLTCGAMKSRMCGDEATFDVRSLVHSKHLTDYLLIEEYASC